MAKESCVTYPANGVFLMVREPLIAICKIPVGNEEGDKKPAPDPQAAAIILHQFIFWTDGKLSNQHQSRYHTAAAESEGVADQQDNSLWIYKDYDELKLDLLDLFGRNKIIDNVQWLVMAGYLKRRTNPRYRWDKTLQYSVDIECVQHQIDALPKFKIKLSIVPNQTIERGKNKRAIPEKTTKKKEELLAPAIAERAEAGSPSHNTGDAPQSQFPAQAEKHMRPATTPSPSLKQKPPTAQNTTAPIPNAAAPLSPSSTGEEEIKAVKEYSAAIGQELAGDKKPAKRSEKQLINDGLVEALRVAFFKGRGKEPVDLGRKDFSNYLKVAQDLVGDGVPPEQFLEYVQYWNRAAQTWPNGLTLNSLVTAGRISDFKSWYASRAKKAISSVSTGGQVSTTPNVSKRAYDKRNDPAYAYLHDALDERKQAK